MPKNASNNIRKRKMMISPGLFFEGKDGKEISVSYVHILIDVTKTVVQPNILSHFAMHALTYNIPIIVNIVNNFLKLFAIKSLINIGFFSIK